MSMTSDDSRPTEHRAAIGRHGRARSDEGMTLVELLVTLVLMLVIMGSFFFMYFGFASSGVSTVKFSEEQGQVRNVERILESDIRSADPLTLLPSSFDSTTLLGGGAVTSSGTYGTSPTDSLAMYENDVRYDPCPQSSTTTTQPPTSYISSAFAANVVWGYNPTAHTLTRYNYVTPDSSASTPTCKTGGWVSDLVLAHVENPGATMFRVSQGTSSPNTQATTPSSTTVTNQAAPACGTTVSVYVVVRNKKAGQQGTFTIRTSVSLPNEAGVSYQAC